METKKKNLLTLILGLVFLLSTALFVTASGLFTAHAANFTVSGVSYHQKVNEMYEFYITVSGYTPTSNSWNKYMKETDSTINVPDKIEINGTSVTAWNDNTAEDAATWDFNMSPTGSSGYYYHKPMVIKGSGGATSIVLYVHENLYNAIVTEYGNMVIQLKSELAAEGNTLAEDTVKYKVNDTAGVPSSVEIIPDTVHVPTNNITVSNWIHQSNELRVFYVNLGDGVMPNLGYDIIDKAASQYLADYITINGSTITEINATTDTSGYTFTVSPSTHGGVYAVPIMVLVDGSYNIQIKIHDTYYATMTGDLTVSVLEGFHVVNGNKEYVVDEDVTYIYKYGTWSKDWQTVHISAADITVSNWIHQSNELRVFYVNLGDGVMPNLGYDIIDKAASQYLADYITINGSTITEINATTDTSGYTFTVSPSTHGGVYAVPIMVLVDGSYNIQIKIHDTYYATMTGDLTVSVLEGFHVVNKNKEYVVDEDVTYIYKHGAWSDNWQTETVLPAVTNFDIVAELRIINVEFGSGVSMPNIAFHAIDDDIGDMYRYITNYIRINGQTITAINSSVDTTGWTFTQFPSNAADKYKIPVIVYIAGNGSKIELKIHENYLATLTGDLTVEVLEDLVIINGTTEYVVDEDVTYIYKYGTWSKDWQVTNVTPTIRNFDAVGELRRVYIDFGTALTLPDIAYGIVSHNADTYKYLAEYIAINGKTIKWINENTDTTGWDFTQFPSFHEGSINDPYALPIIVYAANNDNKIELRIHENYINALSEDLTVSVLENFVIVKDTTEYTVAETVSKTYAFENVAIPGTLTIRGWTQLDDNNIKVFWIDFPAGIVSQLGYVEPGNSNYQGIADYIVINGKTVTAINAETDTTGWEPAKRLNSTEYTLPVLLLLKDDSILVILHSTYYASITGALTVSVTEGLNFVNGQTTYELDNEIDYTKRIIEGSNVWVNLLFKIRYYVNDEPYREVEYNHKNKSTNELIANPSVENGYAFSGWDKEYTDITYEDIYKGVTINGYIAPKIYTITYELDGGENASSNPIKYTIENDTITLAPATKDGYTFDGWYDKDGNKVESIAKGSYGDLTLYAKYTENGCSSEIGGDLSVCLFMLSVASLAVVRLKRKSR